MAGDNSSSFSPAPFTPSGSTRDNQYAGTTVTFPTCLVPQDLIEAGKRWNVNWNRRPEGDDVFANEVDEGEQEDDDGVSTTVRRPEQGDNIVPFPRATVVEPEQSDSIEADDTHRQSGHRFYSNVSEQHRQDVGTLSQVAISPLQWLGGLRCLKVQGGSQFGLDSRLRCDPVLISGPCFAMLRRISGPATGREFGFGQARLLVRLQDVDRREWCRDPRLEFQG
jgi:hypothetical protein